MPLAITPTFSPWTHTSDDSYIHQLSLVLATATVSFSLSVLLCMFVFVDIVIGHLGRPRSTHTAPIPVPMGSVHVQTITKPSRAGHAVSRSELVQPGAATCVFRDMAGPCIKSLDHTYQGTSTSKRYTITVFFCSGKNSAEQASANSTMWAASLRHAASDTTAVRPAVLIGGRGESAVDIVVVAPGTSSSVGRVLGNHYQVCRTN